MIPLKRDQGDFIQDHPGRNGNGSNEIFCRGERDGVTPNAAGQGGIYGQGGVGGRALEGNHWEERSGGGSRCCANLYRILGEDKPE